MKAPGVRLLAIGRIPYGLLCTRGSLFQKGQLTEVDALVVRRSQAGTLVRRRVLSGGIHSES